MYEISHNCRTKLHWYWLKKLYEISYILLVCSIATEYAMRAVAILETIKPAGLNFLTSKM